MQAGWSCSDDCHLGYFLYMSFNETDFINFGKVYNYDNNRSAGYYKPNMTANAHPQSKMWLSSMVRLFHNKGTAKTLCITLFTLMLGNNVQINSLHMYLMKTEVQLIIIVVFVSITCNMFTASTHLSLSSVWFNKRMPFNAVTVLSDWNGICFVKPPALTIPNSSLLQDSVLYTCCEKWGCLPCCMFMLLL